MPTGEAPEEANEGCVESELEELLHTTTVEHALCYLGDDGGQYKNGSFPYGDAGGRQEFPGGQVELLPDEEALIVQLRLVEVSLWLVDC